MRFPSEPLANGRQPCLRRGFARPREVSQAKQPLEAGEMAKRHTNLPGVCMTLNKWLNDPNIWVMAPFFKGHGDWYKRSLLLFSLG